MFSGGTLLARDGNSRNDRLEIRAKPRRSVSGAVDEGREGTNGGLGTEDEIPTDGRSGDKDDGGRAD